MNMKPKEIYAAKIKFIMGSVIVCLPIDTALAAARGRDPIYLVPIAVLFIAWAAVLAIIQWRRRRSFTKLHFVIALWLAPFTFVLFLDPIRDLMDEPGVRRAEFSSPAAPPPASPSQRSTVKGADAIPLWDNINYSARCAEVWRIMAEIRNCTGCSTNLRELPDEAMRKAHAVRGVDETTSMADLAKAAKDAALRYAVNVPSAQRLDDPAKQAQLASTLVDLSMHASSSSLGELVENGNTNALRIELLICALQTARYTAQD